MLGDTLGLEEMLDGIDKAVKKEMKNIPEEDVAREEKLIMDVLASKRDESIEKFRDDLKRDIAFRFRVSSEPEKYLSDDVLADLPRDPFSRQLVFNMYEKERLPDRFVRWHVNTDNLEQAAELEARRRTLKSEGYDKHYDKQEPPWWPGKSLGRPCPEHLKR